MGNLYIALSDFKEAVSTAANTKNEGKNAIAVLTISMFTQLSIF